MPYLLCWTCLHIFSGGTEVTVAGTDLDSVAEPRFNLTTVITRRLNDTILISPTSSISEVGLLIPDITFGKYCSACVTMTKPVSWYS